MTSLHISSAWQATADRLCAADWRRVVVLGARDRGKSTFCRYLAQRLADQAGTVGVLDCDLGQKLVGPPACVTLAFADPRGALDLARLRFVGETNPVLAMAGVIASVARLAGQAGGHQLVVNTSGLIGGPGLALKRWKLDALYPDWVVALAESDELEPILRPLPPDRLVRLAPSPAARRKSEGARARSRREGLADALAGAVPQRLREVAFEELLRDPTPVGPRLCGLADEHGEDLGIGVVTADALPWVKTAVDLARVRRVRLGMALPDAAVSRAPSPGVAMPTDRGRALPGSDPSHDGNPDKG